MLATAVRHALVGLVVCVTSVTLRAQDVIVCWGDSILAGYNSTGDTFTPYGPAPFGDPVPGAWRWDPVSVGWLPVNHLQNHFGSSADPIYGFAAGWHRFHGTDVYFISLAVSGSDASPLMSNPAASWNPQVAGGAFERFNNDYLTPALQSLSSPTIRAVCFAAGNNHLTPSFDADINAVNAAISSFGAPLGATPHYLGIKTYLGTPNDASTVLQRQAISNWAALTSQHHAVETTSIPGRTGGLADHYHLSHYGSIFLGFWIAVTEAFHL